MWGNRISASKGFQQYSRVKNNVLSWFKRKTTQRSNKEKLGSAPKVKTMKACVHSCP